MSDAPDLRTQSISPVDELSITIENQHSDVSQYHSSEDSDEIPLKVSETAFKTLVGPEFDKTRRDKIDIKHIVEREQLGLSDSGVSDSECKTSRIIIIDKSRVEVLDGNQSKSVGEVICTNITPKFIKRGDFIYQDQKTLMNGKDKMQATENNYIEVKVRLDQDGNYYNKCYQSDEVLIKDSKESNEFHENLENNKDIFYPDSEVSCSKTYITGISMPVNITERTNSEFSHDKTYNCDKIHKTDSDEQIHCYASNLRGLKFEPVIQDNVLPPETKGHSTVIENLKENEFIFDENINDHVDFNKANLTDSSYSITEIIIKPKFIAISSYLQTNGISPRKADNFGAYNTDDHEHYISDESSEHQTLTNRKDKNIKISISNRMSKDVKNIDKNDTGIKPFKMNARSRTNQSKNCSTISISRNNSSHDYKDSRNNTNSISNDCPNTRNSFSRDLMKSESQKYKKKFANLVIVQPKINIISPNSDFDTNEEEKNIKRSGTSLGDVEGRLNDEYLQKESMRLQLGAIIRDDQNKNEISINTERYNITNESSFYRAKVLRSIDKESRYSSLMSDEGRYLDITLHNIKLSKESSYRLKLIEMKKQTGIIDKNISQDDKTPPKTGYNNRSNFSAKRKKLLSELKTDKYNSLNHIANKPKLFNVEKQPVSGSKLQRETSQKVKVVLDNSKSSEYRTLGLRALLPSKNSIDSSFSRNKEFSTKCVPRGNVRVEPSKLSQKLEENVNEEYFGDISGHNKTKNHSYINVSIQRASSTTSKYKNTEYPEKRISIDSHKDINKQSSFISPNKSCNINDTFEKRITAWSAMKNAKLADERSRRDIEENDKIKTLFRPNINEKSRELMKKIGTDFQQRCSANNMKFNINGTAYPKKKQANRAHAWLNEVVEIKSLFRLSDKYKTSVYLEK